MNPGNALPPIETEGERLVLAMHVMRICSELSDAKDKEGQHISMRQIRERFTRMFGDSHEGDRVIAGLSRFVLVHRAHVDAMIDTYTDQPEVEVDYTLPEERGVAGVYTAQEVHMRESVLRFIALVALGQLDWHDFTEA